MNKKNKRLLIFGLLLLLSVVVLALGLKYFPFTKVVKMPAGSEKEFVTPGKTSNLSPHTLYYDFEVAPGKDMPGGFYKGVAHSGQYSVKAFGQNSFSIVVERSAGEIGIENLKAVALSAWVYVFPTKNEVKGRLVFTASNEVGVNVCWQGLSLNDPEVPRGKWFKISTYFDLASVSFKPGYKLQVYFWNNSSTDILVDDYFISFGGAVDRRGDSARVDMTRPAGFIPKFNYPPFQVSVLERELVHKPITPGEIGPDDFAVAGDFFNTGNDGLSVIRKDGRIATYAFCRDKGEFRRINLNNAAALSAVGPVKKIVKGRFLSTRTDQLMVIGEKGCLLGVFNPVENICNSADGLQTSLNVLWRSGTPAGSIHAGDFNGDGRTEILEIGDNGSWGLKMFEPDGKTGGSWKILSGDDNQPINEWNRNIKDIGISIGRFFPVLAHDVVLTVTRNKSDGKYAYSLRKLNISAGKWEPVFSEKQNYLGKTYGLDTLKPADAFFTASCDGRKMIIYRYNRDWRYDLKEIIFNDTTFNIVSTVDFHGYDRDQSPRYYESLKLIPGNFLNPSRGSFLAIGHVSKTRHYQDILPDFIHLYSLPANK